MADSTRSRALQAAAAAGLPAGLRELVEGQPVDARGELVFKGNLRDGGISWVMRVLHRGSEAHRALKVLRPELLSEASVVRALEEDLGRATAVPGDFVVRLFDFGRLTPAAERGGQTLWSLTMEWIEGRSIREEMARAGGLLSPERAFSVALQAARATSELHRCGLVHADIRPEQLLVGRSNAVCLIDYGVAPAVRERAEALWGVPWRSSPLAPPELAREGRAALRPAVDVYQLALLTYELFVGQPCSPFVAYEELAELVDLVPAELDELILDCLGEPETRPADAGAFFARLREAEYAYSEALRRGRPRAERKPKAVWAEVSASASLQAPPWSRIATACERLLEEKPGRLPFGKLPTALVEDLLRQARSHLQATRRRHLDDLLREGAWREAGALLDLLGDEVPGQELAELRADLELARLEAAGDDPVTRAAAGLRLSELLRDPDLAAARRAAVSRKLEELLAAPPPPPPAPRRPEIRTFTDLGVLPSTERWRLTDGETTESIRIALGPAVRLGRGSYAEFGNHLDLRPTRGEVANDSTMLSLAQTLSRAGHLELRVGADGLEAFCLGTHGATVDGAAIVRGERAPLGEVGECSLAQGAAVLAYRVVHDADGAPAAVELRFTAGIGAGRRAYWVISSLPAALLAEDVGRAVALAATPEGWQVTARGDGVCLGEAPLAPGSTAVWEPDVPLLLPGGRTITRS